MDGELACLDLLLTGGLSKRGALPLRQHPAGT